MSAERLIADSQLWRVHHDVHRSTAALIPCIPLAALAAWLTALGLEPLAVPLPDDVPPRLWMATIAAALHAAWILPAFLRRAPALVAVAWLVCVAAARAGFVVAGFSTPLSAAVVLEGIVLALALSATERASWAERLARWRRARQEIATQLQMGEGLLLWTRTCVDRIVSGRAERPALAAVDRIVADLADAQHRVQSRLASLAMPEQAWEAVLASAQALTAEAEVAASRFAADIERRALCEAAACGDLVRRLPDVPEADRDRLARECEAMLIGLAHRAGRAGTTAFPVAAAPVGQTTGVR